MVHRLLQYSKITKGPATITVPFIDNRGDPRYLVHQQLSSGCCVLCSSVYSLCKGVVVYVGYTDHFSVIVQYSSEVCITYSNLSSVSVDLHQSIDSCELVGTADGFVLVELLQPSGTSRVWPVRVGAYDYYKQDPEPYLSDQSLLPDSGASAYLSEVYPQTFNYELLSPYIVTLHENSPQMLDWPAIQSLRVSGAICYAGRLFDANHVRQAKFIEQKLPQWISDIQKAKLLFGYYFIGRATNQNEAQSEIYELSYIIRNWPSQLGVWVKPDFTRTVTTNNLILDTYRDALIDLGLAGAIGIYTDRRTMNQFTWSAKQSDWLLWLVDRCQSVSDFDRALNPDFFRLENT